MKPTLNRVCILPKVQIARLSGTLFWLNLLMMLCIGVPGFGSVTAETALPTREHLTVLVQRLAKEPAIFPRPFQQKLARLVGQNDRKQVVSLLAKYTLLEVEINPEARVKLKRGLARPVLHCQKASLFLVRVHNEAGVTSPLRLETQEMPESQNGHVVLQLERGETTTGLPSLHGVPAEYVLLRVTAPAQPGMSEVTLRLDVGQGTQDLGFRSELPILFRYTNSTSTPRPSSLPRRKENHRTDEDTLRR